jgi:hypothetical protein|tara:strand:- start:2288 stop:3679 length:1392 start_codon:yes stop_codon:yes gene_type:complete
MKFFKNLKESILGSIKEDLNSALGGKQALFNSKISGALDDLISMKTGINISNIPSKITEEAALASEARRRLIKNPDKAVNEDGTRIQPSKRAMLRFPTSNDRFIDNWIVFRTRPRKIDAGLLRGVTHDGDAGTHGFNLTEGEKDNGMGNGKRHTFSATQRECLIALYFPNNVKDTIQVDYETKDVGLGEAFLTEFFGNNQEGFDFDFGIGDTIQEAFKAFGESIFEATAQQEGSAVANPKLLNFGGVGMREHTYTFALNPYNEADAQEITDIIYWFKLMSLPMSSNENPRISILPAEWEINFKGPILGHIEHPQNCFLSTVDVDYSGGKDMSFIESASADVREDNGICTPDDDQPVLEGQIGKNHKIQHYPNGVTLTLTFKEILNIDRLRYVGRVAASARGANQDTQREIKDFELGMGNNSLGPGQTGANATEEGDIVAGSRKPRGSHNADFGRRGGSGSHND